MRTTLAALFLVAGCARAPVSPPGEELELSPLRPAPFDAGAGTQALSTSPIFLGSAISQAAGPVFVVFDNVDIEPGSEAEVYLIDPGSPGDHFDPTAYVGSIATVVGNPSRLPRVVLEINDFEADGKKYQARTKLRGMAGISIAVVVKKGAVQAQRIVVTTRAPT